MSDQSPDKPHDQPPDQAVAVDQQKVIDGVAATPQTKLEKQQAQALGDLGRLKRTNQLTMHVKVYSPFRDYYDGQSFSISAENATGPFDILPKHHNFISLLSPCELVIRSMADETVRIRISGGIMHVKADYVIVFLDV